MKYNSQGMHLFGLLGCILLLLSFETQAASICYGSNLESFWYCSGYESVGYSCSGSYCAIDQCVAACTTCAVEYVEAFLHKNSGRCCSSIDGDICIGPKDALGPPNPFYGFPQGAGAIVVQGAFEYKNGPASWKSGSEEGQNGAYGWTSISPTGNLDKDCPAIPEELNLDSNAVLPISLIEHGDILPVCQASCNVSNVISTGIDPCSPGSVTDPFSSKMSCFYGGPEWLGDSSLGLCGYPCFVFQNDGETCSQDDINHGKCALYCDPRTFPSLADNNQNKTIHAGPYRVDKMLQPGTIPKVVSVNALVNH